MGEGWLGIQHCGHKSGFNVQAKISGAVSIADSELSTLQGNGEFPALQGTVVTWSGVHSYHSGGVITKRGVHTHIHKHIYKNICECIQWESQPSWKSHVAS